MYPLNRMLGGVRRADLDGVEERKSLALTGIQTLDHVVHR